MKAYSYLFNGIINELLQYLLTIEYKELSKKEYTCLLDVFHERIYKLKVIYDTKKDKYILDVKYIERHIKWIIIYLEGKTDTPKAKKAYDKLLKNLSKPLKI